MTYGGKISQQVSDGKLILLGSQQTAAVQLTAPVTPVFKDSSESEILYVLPEGTKDSIDRYTEDHFYLSSGGCIQKDSARILTSTADIYTLSKRSKMLSFRQPTAENTSPLLVLLLLLAP